jgi:hypothetical protein
VPVAATRYLGTIRDFVMLKRPRSKLSLGALAAASPRSRL